MFGARQVVGAKPGIGGPADGANAKPLTLGAFGAGVLRAAVPGVLVAWPEVPLTRLFERSPCARILQHFLDLL